MGLITRRAPVAKLTTVRALLAFVAIQGWHTAQMNKNYTVDLIQEYGMSNATPPKIPMDSHLKLTPFKETAFTNPSLINALLKDMEVKKLSPAIQKCDNLAALSIAANPVLHKHTKHVEVDYHFTRDKLKSGSMTTTHVSSSEQIAYFLTKPLSVKQHHYLLHKLGASLKNCAQLAGE
ncbi:hypothetical protein AgCh_024377 [Apium graveolens]